MKTTVATFHKVDPKIVADCIKKLPIPGGFFNKTLNPSAYASYEDAIDPEFKLPQRSTYNAAGYDFYYPLRLPVDLYPGDVMVVPTGVCCEFHDPNYFMSLHLRSSIGIKRNVMLANTTGIIDADYFEGENNGHIMVALYNYSDLVFTLNPGDRFAQGILMPYAIATNGNDNATQRTGGIGSTGN